MEDSKEPDRVRCTRKIEDFVTLFLEVCNSSGLNLVLLLVIGFTELVFDVHFTMDLINSGTLLVLGIVPFEGRGSTMFADEVLVHVRKRREAFETIYIDAMGFGAIEDLCTACP